MWCEKRGLLLIEDAAQAWLSSRHGTPTGSHGDLSIFCLYKTFGVPEGAAVISRSPPEPTQPARQRGIVDIVRRHGTYLSQQWGWLAELRRRLGRGDANSLEEKLDPELRFGLGGPEFGPNATISFLLKRVTDPAAQERRAANYNFLLERLRSFVPKQFAHPPEGASPFAFPIRHDRGEELIDRLARHSVFARRLWAHPHPCLPQADFAGAAALRKSVIIVPVHQELRVRDLERIVAVVYSSLRSMQESVRD